MSNLHSFETSTNQDDAEWWATVYTRFFVDYVSHEVVTDVGRQKQGIDHVVGLKGDRRLLVDVKTRERWYDDILLEVWSSKEDRTPGWLLLPLHCHYIAYATPSVGFVYMAPFQHMRRAYERNKHRWKQLAAIDTSPLRIVEAHNTRYTTVSVAVPFNEFDLAMAEASRVHLDEILVRVPTPWDSWERLTELTKYPFEPPEDIPDGVSWYAIDKALAQLAEAMEPF